MNKLYAIMAVILFATAIMWAFIYGVKKHEKNECMQWYHEANVNRAYFLVRWQLDQCLTYGVIFPPDIPVYSPNE